VKVEYDYELQNNEVIGRLNTDVYDTEITVLALLFRCSVLTARLLGECTSWCRKSDLLTTNLPENQ